MIKIKDKKIFVLIAILFVFTISYFLIANKISYAFENNYDSNATYAITVDTISKCAQKYGEDNKESFNEEGLLYITVQTLIDNGYLASNEEGKIINPLSSEEFLNDKKIRIKNIEDKITAEIYS